MIPQEAAELVSTAEARGVIFSVSKGSIFCAFDENDPSVREIVQEIQEQWAALTLALLAMRAASASVLAELWESDAELRRRFRTLEKFNEHAHAVAHRYAKRLDRDAFFEREHTLQFQDGR